MDGIKEPAYLRHSLALDHTSWTGLLRSGKSNIIFSDIDAVLERNQHFIFCEFKYSSTDKGWTAWELPQGQLITYSQLLATHGDKGILLLATHNVHADDARAIDTLHDVTGFSIVVHRDGVLLESNEMPASKWQSFIVWANENHHQWPGLHQQSWFSTGAH